MYGELKSNKESGLDFVCGIPTLELPLSETEKVQLTIV